MAKASQNVTETTPDEEPRARAAVLLAEDRLSDEQIAAEVGVTRRTLARWKTDPAYLDHVRALVREMERRVLDRGIARRARRIAALNDRHERMHRVITARAIDLANVPGGDTGLLVRQLKQIGSGRDAQTVEEYAVDTGLLREMREHEKQAAQELGQWTQQVNVTQSDEEQVRAYARSQGHDADAFVAKWREVRRGMGPST